MMFPKQREGFMLDLCFIGGLVVAGVLIVWWLGV